MTTAQLKELLAKSRVIPLDGAWGTELARLGLEPGHVPESWNIEHPDRVAEVPRAYVNAGARIVLTNTFGGSKYKLDKCGLGDKVREVNEAGALISKKAAGNAALVFASVGPTGEFLEPLGLVPAEEMIAVFKEQIAALVAGGADAILIETMTDLEETACALRAAKALAPDMPVAVSLTFDKGARGYATMMGVTPAAAAKRLDADGADIIGTNCGNGIENMIDIVAELRAHTAKPIWARPNAGMPQLINGATIFPDSPEAMAAKIPKLVKAGATLVGGCCGTTPAHIKAIIAAL